MRFGIRIPPCESLTEVARAARTAEAKRYVTDEAVEQFCLVGTPEECIDRIQELASLGVHQIFLRHYLT